MKQVLAKLVLLGVSLCLVALSTPVLAQNLDATQAYNQGIEAYAKGSKYQALRSFERAATADPSYPDAFYNLGSLYYQLGSYDKATNAFKRVLQLTPTDTLARYNLGLSLEKQQQLPDASWVYRQIPKTDKNYPKAQARLSALAPKLASPSVRATMPVAPASVVRQPSVAPAQAALSPPYGTRPTAGVQPSVATKRPAEAFAKGLYGPTGMALDFRGDLYVANYSKNVILRVTPRGEKTVFAQDAMLHGPIGLVLSPRTGELFVANYLDNNIVRVSPAGKVSLLTSGLSKPYNLYLDVPTNTLYVSEQETNSISKIQLATP
jgi:hypothetical protein